jgi:hypothetical protein
VQSLTAHADHNLSSFVVQREVVRGLRANAANVLMSLIRSRWTIQRPFKAGMQNDIICRTVGVVPQC